MNEKILYLHLCRSQQVWWCLLDLQIYIPETVPFLRIKKKLRVVEMRSTGWSRGKSSFFNKLEIQLLQTTPSPVGALFRNSNKQTHIWMRALHMCVGVLVVNYPGSHGNFKRNCQLSALQIDTYLLSPDIFPSTHPVFPCYLHTHHFIYEGSLYADTS